MGAAMCGFLRIAEVGEIEPVVVVGALRRRDQQVAPVLGQPTGDEPRRVSLCSS